MKKNVIIFITTLSLLLCGCNIIKKKSSSSGNTSEEKTGTVNIEIYATNDIHGQVKESNSCPGIGKLATYLKTKKARGNTLLLDQGDAWQGSIYSNMNRGALITDIMNFVHFDARCIGNHDFDWGLDAIKANTQASFNGYSTPVLAGNIYDYNFDTKTEGNIQQSDIGVKSIILNVDDLKIGVLGGIGQGQITSINSLFVRDITFKNHINYIKEEANHLRNDEKCDIIIGSMHTGQEDLIGKDLNSYVDLFLCGHTHTQETYKEGQTVYVQSKGYEQSFAHITLTYDYSKKAISNTTVSFLNASDVLPNVQVIDPTIQEILDTYNVDTLANTTYANNVVGTFDRYKETTNLMNEAIMDRAIVEGYGDIICTMTNEARQALPSRTSWTYADVFQSFPFDNEVYIATVKGSELRKNFNYNNRNICRNPNFTEDTLELDGEYKIAVLDYVYFHTDNQRNYDNFSITGGTSTTKMHWNYRDILLNWLIDSGSSSGTPLKASDFSSSNWAYNKSAFSFV